MSNALGDVNADTAHSFEILSKAAYEASGSMDANEQITRGLSKADAELEEKIKKAYTAADGFTKLVGGDLPDALYENEEAAQAVIDSNRELAETQD